MLLDFFNAILDVAKNSATYEIGIRFAAVLGFAAIGEWVAEKAGTMNISIEGMILAAAFAGAVGYDISGSTSVGLLFAVFIGFLVSSVQANMSHRLKVNQFVVGLTLNVLILALVSFLLVSLQPVSQIASNLNIPLLSKIPIFGTALFGQSWPIYLIIPLGVLAWWLVYKTRWGLELRAAGENENSATAMGVLVDKRRRQAIYFCGISSGLAGGYLLLGQIGRFENSIVAGKGFIVIAAVVFGGWKLKGALLGCGIFGFVTTLKLILPATGHMVNAELLTALPFIVTILLVAIVMNNKRRKAIPPAAFSGF